MPASDHGTIDGLAGLGKRIQEARLALAHRRRKEFPQTELAEALGVSAVTVGRWENGEKFPEVTRLPLIAAALQCDPGWMVFGPRDGVPLYEGDGDQPRLGPTVAAPARPARGRRARPENQKRRHHELPPVWYGHDALGDDVAVERHA